MAQERTLGEAIAVVDDRRRIRNEDRIAVSIVEDEIARGGYAGIGGIGPRENGAIGIDSVVEHEVDALCIPDYEVISIAHAEAERGRLRGHGECVVAASAVERSASQDTQGVVAAAADKRRVLRGPGNRAGLGEVQDLLQ